MLLAVVGGRVAATWPTRGASGFLIFIHSSILGFLYSYLLCVFNKSEFFNVYPLDVFFNESGFLIFSFSLCYIKRIWCDNPLPQKLMEIGLKLFLDWRLLILMLFQGLLGFLVSRHESGGQQFTLVYIIGLYFW